ncbi:hypothetical protein [Halococcus saccharolyticus]|uniref:DUF7964 domain-containing protein n=1 Tax=Halococcus saccharolyticus DSM 5350 TaxID=1227455 RepID=M0MPJ7_9EURY|nr:hypothetical protein [Halococcus saccharolyticus]EMA46654.1 hypothetical protein C449_03271 [Halococcus saccharolyticus DSM 5350]
MSLIGALPSAPLDRADAETIRARNDVDALIVLGTSSMYARRSRYDDPATEAVVLVDGDVCGLSYDESGWSREVLRRDADRHEHLEATLQWSSG